MSKSNAKKPEDSWWSSKYGRLLVIRYRSLHRKRFWVNRKCLYEIYRKVIDELSSPYESNEVLTSYYDYKSTVMIITARLPIYVLKRENSARISGVIELLIIWMRSSEKMSYLFVVGKKWHLFGSAFSVLARMPPNSSSQHHTSRWRWNAQEKQNGKLLLISIAISIAQNRAQNHWNLYIQMYLRSTVWTFEHAHNCSE